MIRKIMDGMELSNNMFVVWDPGEAGYVMQESEYEINDIRYLIPDPRLPMRTLYHISYNRYPVSGIRHHTCRISHPASSVISGIPPRCY